MSAQEIQTLAEQFADAFNKKDLKAVLNMLSEDLEVFDHVPYRFDNKAQFASFLTGAVEGIASMSFGFRQLSSRVFNENTGIVNAYDQRREGPDSARSNYLGLRQTERAVEDRECSFLSTAPRVMNLISTLS